jgi:hypothetical protein
MGTHGIMLWEQLQTDSSTKEQVTLMAKSANANLMLVGMHGRKGPKS